MQYKNYNIKEYHSYGRIWYEVEDELGFLKERFDTLEKAKKFIEQIYTDIEMNKFLHNTGETRTQSNDINFSNSKKRRSVFQW